ncbi:hypothetical protein H1R20_g13176, partial [Candolleomyces eurysporus]
MSRANGVAVFWNLDHSPLPDAGPSTTTKGIRRICQIFGETIKVFKAYSSSIITPAASASLLHTQGVTVTYSPSSSRKSVIVTHMTVEILVKVMDDKTIGTIVLIAADRDYAYMIARVMDRGIRVVVMAPNGTACSSSCLLWPDAAILADNMEVVPGLGAAVAPDTMEAIPGLGVAVAADTMEEIPGLGAAITTGPLGFTADRIGDKSMDTESDEEVEIVNHLLMQDDDEGSDCDIICSRDGEYEAGVESDRHTEVKNWNLTIDKPYILPFIPLPNGLGGDENRNDSSSIKWPNLTTSDGYRHCPPPIPSRSGAFRPQIDESSRDDGHSTSPWQYTHPLSLRTPEFKPPSNDCRGDVGGSDERRGDKDGSYLNYGNSSGPCAVNTYLPIPFQSPFTRPPNLNTPSQEPKKEGWDWKPKDGSFWTTPPPTQFTIDPWYSWRSSKKQKQGWGKRNDRGPANNSNPATPRHYLPNYPPSASGSGYPVQHLGKRKRRQTHSDPAKKTRIGF